MNNPLNEVLRDVTEEVFGSLAFVLLAFEEEASPPPEGADRTAASISFTGVFQGTLVVSASDALLPTVAANMLGLDFGEEPSEDLQRDAFKELLNVICGNLLPQIAGDDAIFNVGAAELLADGAIPATVDDHPPEADIELHLEDGWAELALFAPACIAANAEPTR